LDHAKFCDGAEIRGPAKHRGGDELHRHRFERPIVKEIQRAGQSNFSRERDRKTNKLAAAHSLFIREVNRPRQSRPFSLELLPPSCCDEECAAARRGKPQGRPVPPRATSAAALDFQEKRRSQDKGTEAKGRSDPRSVG